MESNQTAAREARRFLADRVRDDWDWPDTPPPWVQADEELHGVLGFRERFYSTTSGSEADPDPAAGAAEDPYKFDSPDSVAVAVESKLESRKRKRRDTLTQELAWNEGMACFVGRRDAWTGAASVRKYGAKRRSTLDQPEVFSMDMDKSRAPDSAVAEDGVPDSNGTQTAAQTEANTETLLPVASPLLPLNAIRGSISSKIYPDIYNKVVVSARTPSVPINLADMTRALVQGWKDNGEWPPKAGPLDPLPGGRKRINILRSSVGKGEARGDDAFLAHHPHVKRGVDSVRKIFRLSGSHSDAAPPSPTQGHVLKDVG